MLLVANTGLSPVQARNKTDRKVAKQLEADISYLASDELQGRRTGSDGEHKAADYIENRYKQLGIGAYKGQYRYPFNFTYGREIGATTQLHISGKLLRLNEDAFPLPFSGTKQISSDIFPDVAEQGSIWLLPLYKDEDQAGDAHFDAEKQMYDAAKEAQKGGAAGVVFYDGFGSKWEPSFNTQSDLEAIDLPVVYLRHKAYDLYVKQAEAASQKGSISIELVTAINRAPRTGTNVAAYIDNGAPYTVVIGAHYDHLGLGEDGNSLFPNAAREHMVHHGADDNASGTAGLLEVAKWIKGRKLHHFNYLFIHFSGEELGLYGSKAFVKDQRMDSAQIAYMINMDMIGRLNDSTHALTVGGVGTSPVWEDVVKMGTDQFKITIDSSGIGPSDHTSFYSAGIPVLFFFTGQHKDYHKPSDIAASINYPGEVMVLRYAEDVLLKMDKENEKPAYLLTRQQSMGTSNFKVTLGIMPDYTFQEGGVKVDGVSDGRPAYKAGIKQGDIIIQLGAVKVQSMQSYMEALGSLSPGDKTTVKILRESKEINLPVEMSK